MLPRKPQSAPDGQQRMHRAVPAVQGGSWTPLIPETKLSARSVRKHVAGNGFRNSPPLASLETVLPTSRSRFKEAKLNDNGLKSSRTERMSAFIPQHMLAETPKDELGDSMLSSRWQHLSQESSFYETSVMPTESFQSPVQTRMERDIAHRSAKMIASLEMGFEQEKIECPPSLLRLRFQEHRFLIDELYQQQDLRKDLEEKYSRQKEELSCCMERLRTQENHTEFNHFVEEIRRLKAYGESLERDNHITLQRLEKISEQHSELQAACKSLLKITGIQWLDDHAENLQLLLRFKYLYVELGALLENEQVAKKEKLEELRDLGIEHQCLKDRMKTALEKTKHLEFELKTLRDQCQAFTKSCGLPWHQDSAANLTTLAEAASQHKELKELNERLKEKSAKLQTMQADTEVRCQRLEAEAQAVIEESQSSIEVERKACEARISVIEDRCTELTGSIQRVAETYKKSETEYKDLKICCQDMAKSLGKQWQDDPILARVQLEDFASKHVALNQQHMDLQAVHTAIKEEHAVVIQRESTLVAQYEAKVKSLDARVETWEQRFKVLAKAHAQLESQWLELREWRLPEPQVDVDGLGQPKDWGIRMKQLTEFYEEINEDLDQYCSVHDFFMDGNEAVHVCRKQPCPYEEDHRGVKRKRRIEVADRTILQPMVPNMHVVVDRYVKPQCLAKGRNVSFSNLKNPNGAPISVFVSHTWQEPFRDFISTLKLAVDEDEVVWVCSFAIPQTQKQGIEAMLTNTDLNKVPFTLALKHAVKLVVVLDKELNILERAWCIYELERARRWGIPTLLWAHQPAIFLDLWNCVDTIDFRKATATYPEDLAAIVKAIEEEGGFDLLNHHLRRCIRDRAAICEMAVSELKGELEFSNEELAKLRQKTALETQSFNRRALDGLLQRKLTLKHELEQMPKDGDGTGVEELKQELRTLEFEEAALLQEQNLLVKMCADMDALLNKDTTALVIDGVSNKLLGVLEPMLEQFITENRRSVRGMRMSISKKGQSQENLQTLLMNSSGNSSSSFLEQMRVCEEGEGGPPQLLLKRSESAPDDEII